MSKAVDPMDEAPAPLAARPALPVNWTAGIEFHQFDSYERGYAHQIEQNLAALPREKALILLNFLANSPPYGVE